MALADMDGNETFEASNLGTAEEVGSLLSNLAASGLCPTCHSIPASRLELSFSGRVLGSSCKRIAASCTATRMHSTASSWPQHNVHVPCGAACHSTPQLAVTQCVCSNAGGGGDGGG